MQVIFLFFHWIAKLKCHEIDIFARITKLKCRKMQFRPKKPRIKMIVKFLCNKGNCKKNIEIIK